MSEKKGAPNLVKEFKAREFAFDSPVKAAKKQPSPENVEILNDLANQQIRHKERLDAL